MATGRAWRGVARVLVQFRGAGVGRGLFVSNTPLNRPTRFGTTIMRGALPLGWDAELYRNGQLLAYQGDSVDGRFEFEVPLVHGNNDLEVVLTALQALPEIDRAAVLMRADDEMAYEEIARALGISLSAAKVKVHRARLKLAEARRPAQRPPQKGER